MNRQRKVVITVTYNDMGVIVDTKAEELDLSAQPEKHTIKRTETHACDLISRRDVLNFKATITGVRSGKTAILKIFEAYQDYIKSLPSAQPEQDILSWLLAYHTKSFDLHGRYMPHEVIGWLVHDFANAYMAERREE